MPRLRPGHVQLGVAIPAELMAGLDALCAATGRGIAVEVEHALRRHLAAPPAVVTPPLPPVALEAPPPGPVKRKPGRKRKGA